MDGLDVRLPLVDRPHIVTRFRQQACINTSHGSATDNSDLHKSHPIQIKSCAIL